VLEYCYREKDGILKQWGEKKKPQARLVARVQKGKNTTELSAIPKEPAHPRTEGIVSSYANRFQAPSRSFVRRRAT
jgi:hypothetical protein